MWCGLIKLPAPWERLLTLSDTLQRKLEYFLFQEGCQGTNFSVTWVYAFIILASRLKPAMPASKRWTRCWWNAIFKHSMWTVAPWWPFPNSGWNFHHLSFGSFRGVVAPSSCVVLPCVIPEGRDRKEPAFIYLLIAFCWCRSRKMESVLCVNALAGFGRWDSVRREDRLWEVTAPGIQKPVIYFKLLLQSKQSLVINSICKLWNRQWELWQWFTPIILIRFTFVYKIRLFGYFDNTHWQELCGCDILVCLLLLVA